MTVGHLLEKSINKMQPHKGFFFGNSPFKSVVPKSRHYRNVTKTIFTKSEKSQSSSWSERNARLNMVPNCPKWPSYGLNIAPVIQHSVGLSQDFSQILKHLKQVEARIQ